MAADPTYLVVPVVHQPKLLQVPLYIATGQYEKLTNEELLEHYADIRAEIQRRDTSC